MSRNSSSFDTRNISLLTALRNEKLIKIIDHIASITNPLKITVLTDSERDRQYIRNLSLKNGEEFPLKIKGHTYHFDGIHDQGRDKENTKVLLKKGEYIGKYLNTIEKGEGLAEIFTLLKNSMLKKEMFVMFFCLGPLNSRFSIPAVQITDSSYVAHSESILYRPGYEYFKKLAGAEHFFIFIHTTGKIEKGVSKNWQQKRIYIDLEENRVFSVNTQYAGNSIGLKKMALRLAINKANNEDWLCEHMLLLGVKQPSKKRTTYFTGAYPSACGKTSTAMLKGQSMVGDDMVYIKKAADGKAYAVNVEQGIFGIITDINKKDDPVIYKALNSPQELIFSNILVKDSKPYWLGMKEKTPSDGINFSGNWFEGKKDDKGNSIPLAHKNARYTVHIEKLPNADKRLNDPDGVPVAGFIYGGRDSDTTPPVVESFNWIHGVFMGAIIESETTAATLGQEGVRKHNPMANFDFLVVPLGKYLSNHLKFGQNLTFPPKIFTTNYFLKENGSFLNDKRDKKIWLYWMDGRVNHEFGKLETPIGFIPKFEDLGLLFKEVFAKKYDIEDYEKQFSIRIPELLGKLDRVEVNYRKEPNIPDFLYKELENQRRRLKKAHRDFGKDILKPYLFI